MTKLSDTRETTIADADFLMENLALLECELAKLTAECEAEIAETKSRYETKANPVRDQIHAASRRLSDYILTHPEEFENPRARQTTFGKYGRRNVSNVTVHDETRVIAWAVSQSPAADDVLKHTTRLRKPALRKRLADGCSIPGCELDTGEQAFYKVDQAIIEEAIHA